MDGQKSDNNRAFCIENWIQKLVQGDIPQNHTVFLTLYYFFIWVIQLSPKSIYLTVKGLFGTEKFLFYLPRFSSGFHVVGECDIVGPNVVLPLAKAQNTAQNTSWVNPDTHIQMYVCRFNHRTGIISKYY